MPQDSTVCQDHPFEASPQVPHPPASWTGSTERTPPTGRGRSSTIPLVRHHHAPPHGRGWSGRVLLRKEVIQPHLPVRLPCYDFVPIASPPFDSSLPYGLGHRLRELPTFVT